MFPPPPPEPGPAGLRSAGKGLLFPYGRALENGNPRSPPQMGPTRSRPSHSYDRNTPHSRAPSGYERTGPVLDRTAQRSAQNPISRRSNQTVIRLLYLTSLGVKSTFPGSDAKIKETLRTPHIAHKPGLSGTAHKWTDLHAIPAKQPPYFLLRSDPRTSTRLGLRDRLARRSNHTAQKHAPETKNKHKDGTAAGASCRQKLSCVAMLKWISVRPPNHRTSSAQQLLYYQTVKEMPNTALERGLNVSPSALKAIILFIFSTPSSGQAGYGSTLSRDPPRPPCPQPQAHSSRTTLTYRRTQRHCRAMSTPSSCHLKRTTRPPPNSRSGPPSPGLAEALMRRCPDGPLSTSAPLPHGPLRARPRTARSLPAHCPLSPLLYGSSLALPYLR